MRPSAPGLRLVALVPRIELHQELCHGQRDRVAGLQVHERIEAHAQGHGQLAKIAASGVGLAAMLQFGNQRLADARAYREVLLAPVPLLAELPDLLSQGHGCPPLRVGISSWPPACQSPRGPARAVCVIRKKQETVIFRMSW